MSGQTRWDRETGTEVPDQRQAWSFTLTVRVRGTKEQALEVHRRVSLEHAAYLDGATDALPNTMCSVTSKITEVAPGDLTIEAVRVAQ